MLKKLLAYIREHRLLRAGDRLAVAVSGGADSVALLRALLELRPELGVVLSVVHLHHGIRGAEADADAAFVRDLAQGHDLELHATAADVPAHASAHHQSLEAAGRELRYHFFNELIAASKVDRVATAHNFDDQAETVLLRLMRGAWTRGLSGIYPAAHDGQIVRPLLSTSRREIIEYLRTVNQPWREDLTNRNRDFLRNRVRHELLPLLERDFNPAIRKSLSNLADIARAEQDYWSAQTDSALQGLRMQPEDSPFAPSEVSALRADALIALPFALQRRVILAEAHNCLGLALQFDEVESLLHLSASVAPGRLQLRGAFAELLKRQGLRLLVFTGSNPAPAAQPYAYRLTIPGEIRIPELRTVVRATLVDVNPADGEYNPAQLLDPLVLSRELVVRSWQPGDRFFPLRSRSEEKLKRLLQEKKVLQPEKALWPVITSNGSIVWVRGFAVASQFAFRASLGRAWMIEELPI